MSEFFAFIGEELGDLISFFFTVAILQNVILTTGFGSSLMIREVRKPKTIWLFTGLLTGFSVLTIVIAYPLDQWLGSEETNLWRPFMIIAITVVLYVAAYLLLKAFAPTFHNKVERMLPMAAFNNLVTGIALVCNTHHIGEDMGLGGNVGLAIGACLSFGVLTWLVAEGVERMDNPDMPEAFRGMPSILLYVGILAMALMGFASDSSFINF
ncbi:MAG: hypothetical protein E7527_06480 [Ruminococcaceae bacterium]|nr:hypothetical protein [Oscillospiraceae bacterium]